MALTPGTRLGVYEITAQIGEGGMGQVYRATDTKLKRQVAIKILPPTLTVDADRCARFQREAEVLASLNHPGIAAIHGLEEGGGMTALVMELVEGEDLSQRIAHGAIPIDDALPIAKQIADALEAAHEQGIVHRDLKPANIKVRPDGTVKVLDFGLAKALDPAAGSREPGSAANSPTITTPAMTQAGLILGTAAYMSPEQAKGRATDKRTDVWAFGCVLYEMLTARRAFDGEDVTETIAAVVRGEPDWNALPADTPKQIRLLLKRCLEKDRRARITDIGVAQFLMNETIEPDATAGAVVAPIASGRSRVGSIAAGLVAGAALVAGALAWSSWTPPASPPTVRFTITPPTEQPFVLQGNDHNVTIAPDGSFVVYRTSPPGLAVRAINELEGRALLSSGARFPFVSADSRWVGFFVEGELRKAAVSGGAASHIVRIVGAARGASWGDDGFIVLATTLTDGLQRVSADGGELKVLTTQDSKAQERHVLPHVLPGSRWVLFTVLNGTVLTAQRTRIDALNLVTGERKVVLRGGHDAAYMDSGHLVYATTDTSPAADSRLGGSLRAVRFDADRAEVIGESVSLVEQVSVAPTGAVQFGVSRRGDLVYVPGDVAASATQPRSLVWVNRKGGETPVLAPPHAYAVARISPDGTRIALDARDQANDIWIWDISRQTLTPLNRHGAQDMSPLWTPNSKRVIWASTRGGGTPNLFWQAADGTGTADRLTNHPSNQFPTSITPDGSTVLLFGASPAPEAAIDIFTVPISATDAKAEVLVSTHGRDFGGEVSPNGEWLAYHSDESGEFQVYVRPFPSLAGRWPISTTGGTRAAWARNGRELFYLDKDGMLTSVSVQAAGTSFSAGVPVKILNTRYYSGSTTLGLDLRPYDVAPDGQRFVMIKENDGGQSQTPNLASMVWVVNWVEELKVRLPAP